MVLFLMLVSFSVLAKNSKDIDSRHAEFFGNATPVSVEKESKVFINIKSVKKGNATGWIWKENTPGGNEIRTIDVVFKINEKGDFQIPIFKLYLFDENSYLVAGISYAFDALHENKYISDTTQYICTGKRTYIFRFPIENNIKYKHAIIVMGKNDHISVKSLRKSTPIKELDFPERSLINDMQ
ncbi:MAG: hypothetical protein Q8Q33_07035 [Chlamydiota bacterium]|nr:hypothetical protein [Chlamydiota bacterium]